MNLRDWALSGAYGLCVAVATGQQSTSQQQALVDSAQAEYASGHPARAAAQLEALLPKPTDAGFQHLSPQVFPVVELLGLCYGSMSQDARSVAYLEAGVRLVPKAEEAHTNLAAGLLRLGRADEALTQFQDALALAPHDYTANHNLGEFYVQAGKLADAVPLLDNAQQLKPAAYDNGYDLATADLMLGRYASAHKVVRSLLAVKDTGELHDLDAQIDEKEGKYVEAATEFEAAAHLDPSENNLFDWGSELLLHRTYEPAIDVFRAGTRRYPGSSRLFIGLGMSLYARGLYEQSVDALLAAAAVDPGDPRCYLFLSRAYDSTPSQTDEVIERFRRYAQEHPGLALAQYYYAMSLWKGKRIAGGTADLSAIETLLKSAVATDDKFSQAHFQLGNLYADRHEYERSLPEYLRVVQLDPNLADAHYRLGTDYAHLGQKDKARVEYGIYQKLRSEHMAEVDKERAEVQQFVYAAKAPPAASP